MSILYNVKSGTLVVSDASVGLGVGLSNELSRGKLLVKKVARLKSKRTLSDSSDIFFEKDADVIRGKG